jgi:hypothetical protein
MKPEVMPKVATGMLRNQAGGTRRVELMRGLHNGDQECREARRKGNRKNSTNKILQTTF